MTKLNESQLIEQARGLREYLAQIDEAGPMTHMAPGTSPARPSTQGDRGVAAHKWDAKYAATNNPDGTAKKPAVAVAKAKPAAPVVIFKPTTI